MNWLKFLRSDTAGSVPTAAQVQNGQIAINTKDKLIYTKTPAGAIVPLTLSPTDVVAIINAHILPVSAGGTGVGSIPAGGIMVGNGTGNIQVAMPSTANYVIKAVLVSGTLQWVQDLPLTNWIENVSTAAPNATIPVVTFTSRLTAADADTAIMPKGVGAFLTQTPDNTATGGNKRGNYAVDFSRTRSANTQVASANYSVLLNGSNNTVSGLNATILNGVSNTASGAQSSVLNGNNNIASGANSTILNGAFITTKGVIGCVAQGSHGNTASQTQSAEYTFFIESSGTTAVRITTDKKAASTNNQIVLQNNSAIFFTGYVFGYDLANANAASFQISGVATRGATAGTTAMLQAASITTIVNNYGLLNPVNVAVVADTTNGAIGINVNGQTSANIRWSATIRTIEVTRA